MSDLPEVAEKQLKIEKIRLLEAKRELEEGLPHLYGWGWYEWAWEFFNSDNKFNFLCAANQISKSSSQIRKCIEWACNKDKWMKLWRTQPIQFWYLYPSKEVATIEFEKKWVPEFMPRGKYKDHPLYGWNDEWKDKNIFAIHFNSGVSVYFKTYAQNVQHLQAGSVSAIFCDEELPEDIFDELAFRLVATNGYFHMVFTATLGQEKWRRTIEEIGNPIELFRGAWKRQVSMYDCLFYIDGSKSHWSIERIEQAKRMCKTDNEVLKRVYGRFVLDEGLKYPSFNRKENICDPFQVPSNYFIYAGVDVGGGKGSHLSAIVFIAVAPDYRSGVVFKCWRGDNTLTTASDVLEKFREMRGNMHCALQCYDYAAKDFMTIASRVGESFVQADKRNDVGEQVLNTLFKNKMLSIAYDDESSKLVTELSSVTQEMHKSNTKDDLIDALRYAATRIPWDFSWIKGLKMEELVGEKPPSEMDLRRGFVLGKGGIIDQASVEAELDEWNDLYET
jgi:phage terminase large subunit-like protein